MAKMGSAEHEFTPLSQLTLWKHGCRVRVRISRMWVPSNPNDGTEFGLDCLLIDDEGKTMQAHVDLKDKKRLEEQLVEGKVYVLSDFAVSVRQRSFMACKNKFMMLLRAQTGVEEVHGVVDSIPLHVFEFVDFRDVPSRSRDKSLLTDVIGQIVEVWGIQQAPKKLRTIEFCTLRIQDLSGTGQHVTLYGNLGYDFYGEICKKDHVVVAVFAGMCVRHYKGNGFTVCSSSASKYYLDLEVPEVQEFLANLHCPEIPIVHLPSQQEIPVNPTQESQSFLKRAHELQRSFRTIKQLNNLSPLELQNTSFLCRVSLINIDRTRGWWYLGCFHCRWSVGGDNVGREFRCSQCSAPDGKTKIWYKLDVEVKDETGTMNLIIFGEQAEGLIGVSAEELVEEILVDDDDDYRYTMPGAIQCILSPNRPRYFEVVLDHRISSGFAVKWVLNEDEFALLQLPSLVQMTEGSSSVSNCSSHPMEEKTVIKTELKNEDEA